MTTLQRSLHRTFGVAAAITLASCALLAVIGLLPGGQPQPVAAQGVGAGSITHTTVADFNVCTVLTTTLNRVFTDTVAANTDGGEIRLASYLEDYFDGTTVDATKWFSGATNLGPQRPVVANGVITFDNTSLRSINTVPITGRYVEIRARFAISVGNGDIGFGRQNQPGAPPGTVICPGGTDCDGSNRLFISLTDPDNAIYANARDGSGPGNPATNVRILGLSHTDFHRYRIEWNSAQAYYYIDGVLYPTATYTSSTPITYTPWVWLYTDHFDPPRPLVVDWLRVEYYPTTSGQYQSCVIESPHTDANWTALSWASTLPGGTGAAFETRSSRDGVTWSAWAPAGASGSTIPSPNGRYLQYRATLSTTNVNASPEIGSVSVGYELNEPPVANAGGPYTVSEGISSSLNGTGSSDPNGDPITYEWDLDYDAVTFTVDTIGSTPSVTLADGPATRTIALRVRDESNLTHINTTTLTVLNLAPVVATPSVVLEPSAEGSPATASATFSDAGSLDAPFTCTVNYGDGSGNQTGIVTGTTCTGPARTYADNGSFTVTMTVTDKDGAPGSNSTSHSVTNVAPVVATPSVVAEPSAEGSPATASASFSDAGSLDAPFTCTVNYGDGSGVLTGTVTGATCTGPARTYADNGSFSVTITVTDKDAAPGSNSTSHSVTNVAPTATFTASSPVAEGSPSTLSLSSPFDPSTADTAAGFRYSFACPGDSLATSYAAAVTATLSTCTFADNGAYTVTSRIFDKNDGFSTYTTTVTATNVAPTASTTGPYSGSEGSPIAFTGNVSDPGSADTHTFLWSLGDGVTATSPSPSHTYADNGVYTAVFTTTDDDGGIGVASTTVTITNVAPTATFAASSPVAEGNPSTLSLSGPFDPSTADTAAGLRYSFACPGDSLATSYAAAVTATLSTCTFADNGTYTVTARIFDKDDGFSTYTATVAVANVAPTASANGPYSGSEGSPIAFTGTFSDPGSGDTHTFLWSFGDGVTSTLRTPSHTYADNGVYTAAFTTTDDDGGIGAASTTVTVTNVAPMATFAATSPVAEGNPSTLSLSSPFDPSTADTAAGFRYSFACPGDSLATSYAAAVTATLSTCTFADNGTYTVTSRIFDKNDGFSTYTTTVSVANVAPTASTTGPYSGSEGSPIAFTGNFSDPGSGDSHTFLWNFGDGLTATSPITSHVYADNGVYTAVFTATDDDGGIGVASTTVTITNVAPIVSTTGPYSGAENSPISFTGLFSDPGSGDSHFFLWDFGDGVTSTGRITSHVYADNGAYTAVFTTTDDDGDFNAASTTVTVTNAAPIVDAGGPYIAAGGEVITFTVAITDAAGDTHTFAWDLDFNGSYETPGQTVTRTYKLATTYKVGVRVTDDDGGVTTDTADVTITVNSPDAYEIFVPLVAKNSGGAGGSSQVTPTDPSLSRASLIAPSDTRGTHAFRRGPSGGRRDDRQVQKRSLP